jgi:heme-degrading monooxygenase HmoA
VVEADEDFQARVASPETSEAHSFRRHPRPSQGTLTNGPTLGLCVVWISPRTPELALDLRDWGDFVHIRHIAAAGIPGFTQISVYENVVETDPRYMHVYEFDNLEAEATFSTMTDFVAPHLGGAESATYAAWADLRAAGGRLFYCNTFCRLGEVVRT